MEEKFLTVVKDALELSDAELKLTDDFRKYTTWNSLTELTLIAALDENFGVGIESEKFKKLLTLADLYEEVKKNAK